MNVADQTRVSHWNRQNALALVEQGGGGGLRNGEQPRPCSGKVLLAVKSLPRWTKHDALQKKKNGRPGSQRQQATCP